MTCLHPTSPTHVLILPAYGSAQKQDLPEKVCAQCGRPFRWRKKWERVWDEVKYCSDRCRGDSKRHRSTA
ncbi:DUF2256 domain-containing protein [Xanthomonas citri pv. eucalyptorum]|nr:DUF2256 domain-containing protein [Xanthomonas axonopodis pv. eucalyptorum]